MLQLGIQLEAPMYGYKVFLGLGLDYAVFGFASLL